MDVLHFINPIAWVGSNILIAYIAVALVLFVIGYYALFDPGATTAGKTIFRFMVSLVGVVGLIFLATYIDPSHSRDWFSYPTDVAWWRPILRFVVYAYVAFTITALAVLLVIRRWYPERIKKTSDRKLVKPRHISSFPSDFEDTKP